MSRCTTSSRRLISTWNLSVAQTSVSRIHDVFTENSPGTLKYSHLVYNEIGRTGEMDSYKREVSDDSPWKIRIHARNQFIQNERERSRQECYVEGYCVVVDSRDGGIDTVLDGRENQRLQFFFCLCRSESSLTRNRKAINVGMPTQ